MIAAPASPRRAGAAVAFALLVCLTLWALQESARLEFTAYLEQQAAAELAHAATGGTPHLWRLRSARDVVAGHPFGAAGYRFSEAGLHLEGSGKPIEVELPHPSAAGLQYFPFIDVTLDAATPGELRVLVREARHAPLLTSQALPFSAGTGREITVDLRRLQWRAGETPAPAPTHAATLGLRLTIPAHQSLLVRSVALQRPADYHPLDLSQPVQLIDPGSAAPPHVVAVYRLPAAAASRLAALQAVAATASPPTPPLFALAQHSRVERQMLARSDLHAVLPDAILIPESALAETFARAREIAASGPPPKSAGAGWYVVALFALAFLLGRLYPPRDRRLRALLEIALTLAAPLWLVFGGNTSGNLHATHAAVIVLTILYACSLSFPRDWQWVGPPAAWMLATAVALLALAIGFGMHAADGPIAGFPDLRHVARYVLWALLQQYLICTVCTERWHIATGSRWIGTYLGALGFALLHTPNGALMLATFVGGLCWCAIWLRHRALLPLAFSHAASALLLTSLLPPGVLHSAEVSLRFFQ